MNAPRLPNSRELTHQQPTEGATLPAQACDNTCSSSPSELRLDPFTVIYGALTTVRAGGAAEQSLISPGGADCPCRGKQEEGQECQPCARP